MAALNDSSPGRWPGSQQQHSAGKVYTAFYGSREHFTPHMNVYIYFLPGKFGRGGLSEGKFCCQNKTLQCNQELIMIPLKVFSIAKLIKFSSYHH